tara:strand:- start:2855 stop:4726 length:1872 start_codon:yes stop_codon:yes gene_type:complete
MKNNIDSLGNQLETSRTNLEYFANKLDDYKKNKEVTGNLNSKITDIQKKLDVSNKLLSQTNAKVSTITQELNILPKQINLKEHDLVLKTQKLKKLKALDALYSLANKYEESTSASTLVKEVCFLQNQNKFDSVLEKLPDINIRDAKGKTPIITAVEHNFFYGIEQLLKNGANLHINDQYGNNALHISVTLGYNNITKTLVESDKTIIFDQNRKGQLPLYLALEKGDVKISKELFCLKIATHCLLEAIKYDNISIAQNIINLDSSVVHSLLNEEKSVLSIAIEKGAVQITNLLLSCKAYLEEALDSNKDIKHLNLSNYALQTPQVKSLNYELLNYNNIIKLSLRKSQIDHEKAIQLSSSFQDNHGLKILDLSMNNLGYVGAKYIACALNKNTSIVSLDISNNNINEVGAIFISTMLKANSTLIALNISNNNIGDVGLIFLSNNLANNKSLSYLVLQNNNIGEKGIEAISDVLKVNNTLTKIVFNGNHINQQGIEYIVKAIDINSSIVTFSGFNNSTELEQIISDKVIKNIKQFEYALQLLNQKTINVSEINCSLLLTTLKQVQVQKEQFILESDTLYKKSSIIKQLTTLTNHLQESEIYIHDDMLVPLIAQIERDQSVDCLDFV